MIENNLFEFEVETPSGDLLDKLITEYVSKKECRTPPNSFFIYRQLLVKKLHSSGLNLQAVEISRLASKNWKTKSPNAKVVFQDAAQTIAKSMTRKETRPAKKRRILWPAVMTSETMRNKVIRKKTKARKSEYLNSKNKDFASHEWLNKDDDIKQNSISELKYSIDEIASDPEENLYFNDPMNDDNLDGGPPSPSDRFLIRPKHSE
ncbi:9417_t:CDS:1 [Ambispora gerdemannii]|uniref:9417_t:CDS:1 n=1 Tax=Ambispora gerdemannii TaxID=144530 RepID=A0A9N8VNV1_9GLOM|nr:9417_t:CDS:1 [Ambispora gerdemannii]